MSMENWIWTRICLSIYIYPICITVLYMQHIFIHIHICVDICTHISHFFHFLDFVWHSFWEFIWTCSRQWKREGDEIDRNKQTKKKCHFKYIYINMGCCRFLSFFHSKKCSVLSSDFTDWCLEQDMVHIQSPCAPCWALGSAHLEHEWASAGTARVCVCVGICLFVGERVPNSGVLSEGVSRVVRQLYAAQSGRYGY